MAPVVCKLPDGTKVFINDATLASSFLTAVAIAATGPKNAASTSASTEGDGSDNSSNKSVATASDDVLASDEVPKVLLPNTAAGVLMDEVPTVTGDVTEAANAIVDEVPTVTQDVTEAASAIVDEVPTSRLPRTIEIEPALQTTSFSSDECLPTSTHQEEIERCMLFLIWWSLMNGQSEGSDPADACANIKSESPVVLSLEKLLSCEVCGKPLGPDDPPLLCPQDYPMCLECTIEMEEDMIEENSLGVP